MISSLKPYLTPLGAIIALVSLFQPWFRGHLTFIGKVVSGNAFPGVFWTVMLGALAVMAIFFYGIFNSKITITKWIVLGLSLLTPIIAAIFLFHYAQRSGAPGVQVHLKHGVLLTFVGLIVAIAGSWFSLKGTAGK
jgi:heme/copper-type cytochrome/quinol oxidase subunit 2